MTYKRILWVDTYPDRGDVRIVAGTAYATESNGYILLLARDANGLLTQLRRSRDVRSGSFYHWSLMAESYNATKLPNVRFWVWGREGWVKLTLEPGQKIELSTPGDSDEGWSHTDEYYEYDADEKCVRYNRATRGSDCDGPHEDYAERWCPVERLNWVACGEVSSPTFTPDWQRGEESQRDHFAESMNY